jgi:hypothetical protein
MQEHAMRRLQAVMLGAFALVLGANAGDAQGVHSGFCKVATRELVNTGQGMVQETLWQYPGAKLPENPLFGRVDMVCADRGTPDSVLQDLGKQVWFNVSGPSGGAPGEGRLSVSDPNLTTGVEGNTGIAVNHLGITGVVTPGHACSYEIWVWSDRCP